MQILHNMTESGKNFVIRILGLVSLAGTSLGYILEHFFGASSCRLCQWERIALLVCGAVAFLMASSRSKVVNTIHAGLWKAGGLVSLYHVLIQMGVLPVPSFCQVAPVMGSTFQDKLASFLNTPKAPCNSITMSILGIPLPVYLTLFFALGAILIVLFKVRTSDR